MAIEASGHERTGGRIRLGRIRLGMVGGGQGAFIGGVLACYWYSLVWLQQIY